MRDYRSLIAHYAPFVDIAWRKGERRLDHFRIRRKTSPTLYAPYDTQPGANPRSAR
jgi:hypothetical protein